MFYYSVGIVAVGIRDITSRAFYSLQDTKTPVKNAVIAVFINMICSIILVKVLGIGGLALSSSIASILGALLLILDLRKKIGNLGLKSSVLTFIKCSIASIIMGILVINSYNIVLNFSTEIIALIISVFIGIFTYYIMNIILRVNEVLIITNQII